VTLKLSQTKIKTA